MISMKTMQIGSLLLLITAGSSLVATEDDPEQRLPIIPGAAGFGMDTPAGSGRHLDITPDPSLARSLVAHWTFDDNVPKTGTLSGDATFAPRGEGQALRLKGKGSLTLPNPEGYGKPGTGFSIIAWVRLEEPGGSVARYRNEDETQWSLDSTANFGGQWRFCVAKAKQGESLAGTRSGLAPALWRQVAGVYHRDGTVAFYINGNLLHTSRPKALPDIDATGTADIVLGKGVNGQLDDVMIFSRALDATEILTAFAEQQDNYLKTRTEVYRVTNLNDSGPGSLRHGILTQERARVIVFEVSGTIALKSPITLNAINAYLTLEGATAPSPGITLKDHGLRIGNGCHDVLLRHLRIRTGDTTIFGRLPAGWTDVDGDGPGTVYSHPLTEEPQKAYGDGDRRSVWWNDENLTEDSGKTTRLSKNTWDWDPQMEKQNEQEIRRSAQGVLYVNVGEDPANGRLEYGKAKESVSDPMTLTPGTRNIVLDHLSTTWGGDMNMQTQGSNVTIRNCLIAEALHHPKHPKGPHSRGLLIFAYGPNQGEYTSVIGNLFAYNMARNPTVAKGYMVIVANNLVSDVKVGIKLFDGAAINAVTAAQANVIQRARYPFLARVTNQETPEQTKTYISPDNRVDGRAFNSVEHIWKQVVSNPFKTGTQPESVKVTTSPVTVPGLKLKPIDEVEDWVLATAGARPADRDPADKRIIENVKTRRGKLPIASQDEVGGWPALAENHRGLALPKRPDADDDGDGYTNLEEWLHGFAAKIEAAHD